MWPDLGKGNEARYDRISTDMERSVVTDVTDSLFSRKNFKRKEKYASKWNGIVVFFFFVFNIFSKTCTFLRIYIRCNVYL